MTERPTILLLASDRTFPGFERRLGGRAFEVVRWETVRFRPVAPHLITRRLRRFGPFDTVVVTSGPGARALVDWSRRQLLGVRPSELEIWAVGPATARAVRTAGGNRVRTAAGTGAAAIAREFARLPPRRVVRVRSDRAGPALARSLRRSGHTVLDLIGYRVAAPDRPSRRLRRAVDRATVVVATSPSAISLARLRLAPTRFARLRHRAIAFGVGIRTVRALRGHGFRRVRALSPSGAQRFTARRLREEVDGLS